MTTFFPEQHDANRTLDRYLAATDQEDKDREAMNFRVRFGWMINTHYINCDLRGDEIYKAAIEEIMENWPIKEKHQVVKCGHDFSLIGEYFKK